MQAPHPQRKTPGLDPERFAREKALAAKEALAETAVLTAAEKNETLRQMGAELLVSIPAIIEANRVDLEAGRKAGLGPKLDRLQLTPERIQAICRDIENVIALPDPVGTVLSATTRPNGLRIERVRTPLGVVGMIYESRPNVTVDAAVLCLKAGNTVVLKGGSEALHSNRAIVEALHRALSRSPTPREAVQLLDSSDRAVTQAFLGLRGVLDVIIPRGGLNLIRFVQDNAKVPVIETGASVVHAYVDQEVEAGQAVDLILNAKTRRVSICGALDVLLLHRESLKAVGEMLAQRLAGTQPQVEVRADSAAYKELAPWMDKSRLRRLDPATDFDTEWLDSILAVAVVDSMEDALEHIRRHSLRHTEAIYTRNAETARKFMAAVDAAVVMHNASTQFTDGSEFGLGAEIGISTQKLHVRGPFALEGLTSIKWLVHGTGQTR
ncbi:MAG: glutamate-5-semialdehyde dehydrogenase, partial [Deltaproteobacteria bacterium]|nr:glutamate-5-semialdehyde dehydrogenase [Deltaproteobacteria bacterium]